MNEVGDWTRYSFELDAVLTAAGHIIHGYICRCRRDDGCDRTRFVELFDLEPVSVVDTEVELSVTGSVCTYT